MRSACVSSAPDNLLRLTDATLAADVAAHGAHAPPQTPADETIQTTTNHPWLTADHGWILASFLHVGEPVQRVDGSTAVVVAVRAEPGAAAMWDLTVSNVHTFAVGSGAFVVHNCPGGTNDSFIGKRMQRRVDDSLLDPPAERGLAPTETATGKPIEIHHINQDPMGPFEEMTPYEHRGPGNFRQNHPYLGGPSRIDRDLFETQREDYWKGEWDRGRWK